jgi:hypothetical protein
MPCHAPVFTNTLEILKEPFIGARKVTAAFCQLLASSFEVLFIWRGFQWQQDS